jgi:hypothetical protein
MTVHGPLERVVRRHDGYLAERNLHACLGSCVPFSLSLRHNQRPPRFQATSGQISTLATKPTNAASLASGSDQQLVPGQQPPSALDERNDGSKSRGTNPRAIQ